MVKDAKATGATIEEAQQAAIAALGAPEDADVQFEVITFPEKKKFGLFGGKLAEVRAFYEAKEERKKVAPVKKSAGAKKQKDPQKADKSASKKKDAAQKKAADSKKDASPKKAGKAAEKAAEPREAVSMEEAPEAVKKAYAYLKTVIEGLGIENYDIDVTRSGKEYFFEVSSEDNYSLLIGRRGETLDSIQYLTRLAANRGKEDGKAARISINVGDYREKRERTLKDIAKKNGRRVRKYGRNMTLNPMNPAERRIIHTTIAEMEGLQSYSVGSESDRRVVIALAEGVEPLQPRNDKGRGRNDRGRGRNDRGGRGRNDRGRGSRDRNDRAAYEPAAPARAPRSDSTGTLYGKIAPKFDAEEIKAKAAAEKAAAAEAAVETVEAVEAPLEAAVVETVEAPIEAVENPVLETAAPTDFEVLFDVPVEGSEE